MIVSSMMQSPSSISTYAAVALAMLGAAVAPGFPALDGVASSSPARWSFWPPAARGHPPLTATPRTPLTLSTKSVEHWFGAEVAEERANEVSGHLAGVVYQLLGARSGGAIQLVGVTSRAWQKAARSAESSAKLSPE
jgi:hypothetical protein